MRGHMPRAARLSLLLLCGLPYVYGGTASTDIDSLIEAVRDTTDRGGLERARAARMLGQLGDARGVAPLIEALADPTLRNPFAKESVCAALADIGDANAVEPLIAFVQQYRDDRMVASGAALRALGEFGDARAMDTLTMCVEDRSCLVRDVALEVLGKMDDPQAAQLLARYAGGHEANARVGAVARDVLERKRLEADIYDLVEELKGGTAVQRAAAWQKLIESDALAVKPLCDLLVEVNTDAERAEQAVPVSKDLGVQAPFELGPAMALPSVAETGGNDQFRLRRLQGRRKELLREGKPLMIRLRRLESNILYPRRFGEHDVLTMMKERQQIVTRLRQINVELWNVNLQIADKKATARGRADGYLQPENVPVELMRRDDCELQCRVIEVLSEIGDPQAAEAIAFSLARHDEQVRTAAHRALVQFGPDVVPVLLDLLQWNTYDPLFGQALIAAIVEMGATTTEPLIAALESEHPAAKEIPRIIARIKAPQALELLVGLLNGSRSEVVALAAQALAELNDPRAVEPLAGSLQRYADYPCACQIAGALGRLGDRRATEALVKHLDRYQGMVRPTFTIEALRQFGDPCAVESLKACLEPPESPAALAAGLALLEIAGADIVPDVGLIVAHQRLDRELIRLLLKNGWEPAEEKEKVYTWIAVDHIEMLRGHWDMVKRVLQADVYRDPTTLGYCPHEVLLAIEKDDPDMIGVLVSHLRSFDPDTKYVDVASGKRLPPMPSSQGRSLAERYVYSGHPRLFQTGLRWLSDHGIRIVVNVPGKTDWRAVSFEEVFGNTPSWQ